LLDVKQSSKDDSRQYLLTFRLYGLLAASALNQALVTCADLAGRRVCQNVERVGSVAAWHSGEDRFSSSGASDAVKVGTGFAARWYFVAAKLVLHLGVLLGGGRFRVWSAGGRLRLHLQHSGTYFLLMTPMLGSSTYRTMDTLECIQDLAHLSEPVTHC
jgi:hypothetical protein